MVVFLPNTFAGAFTQPAAAGSHACLVLVSVHIRNVKLLKSETKYSLPLQDEIGALISYD